jgi:hypothetical protein
VIGHTRAGPVEMVFKQPGQPWFKRQDFRTWPGQIPLKLPEPGVTIGHIACQPLVDTDKSRPVFEMLKALLLIYFKNIQLNQYPIEISPSWGISDFAIISAAAGIIVDRSCCCGYGKKLFKVNGSI